MTEIDHTATLIPSATGDVRASDAEREQVARILRAAAGEGLLTLGEADDRLAALYASRWRSELAPLTADLPDGVWPLAFMALSVFKHAQRINSRR